MASLSLSDILMKNGIDPADTMLIRHSKSDPTARECQQAGKLLEYTSHQKPGFAKGFKYWAVFTGETGTSARLFGIFEPGECVPDKKENMPAGLPTREQNAYTGKGVIFKLKELEIAQEYKGRLVIDWGAPINWYMSGANEKPVLSIAAPKKKVFPGFENLILSYDELKEIVELPEMYAEWQTALSSVYAIYLIVDMESGKQYIGSAYGENGLWGRWSSYVDTLDGGNKEMRKLICYHPERYHKFQFSILQVLSPSLTQREVERVETLYKRKLMTKVFGMNGN